jgi:hypothetical protein
MVAIELRLRWQTLLRLMRGIDILHIAVLTFLFHFHLSLCLPVTFVQHLYEYTSI